MPAGEAIELGTRKSSRFIGSECCSFELSTDFRSCAIPLGADVAADLFSSNFLHWAHQLAGFEAKRRGVVRRKAGAYSCSLRMRFIAIIRHVRFSNRSWLGRRVLVLL